MFLKFLVCPTNGSTTSNDQVTAKINHTGNPSQTYSTNKYMFIEQNRNLKRIFFRSFYCSLWIEYGDTHCVKSVEIRILFWLVFFRILQRKSPYAVRKYQNTDQKNSEIGCFFYADLSFKGMVRILDLKPYSA